MLSVTPNCVLLPALLCLLVNRVPLHRGCRPLTDTGFSLFALNPTNLTNRGEHELRRPEVTGWLGLRDRQLGSSRA